MKYLASIVLLGTVFSILWIMGVMPFSKVQLVQDHAQIFTPEAIDDITSYHTMMLDRYGIDYRVITVNNEIDIDLYAAKHFEQLEVGSKSTTSRGLLLVIDVLSDRARLEVSGNLESVFTDGFVMYVEKRQMVPFFNLGRVADGVLATGEILYRRANNAQEGQEFDSSQFSGSLGGGAQTKAGINEGRNTTFSHGKTDVLAAPTPEESLKRYFAALQKRNGRSDLDVFTPESRKFMRGMVNTPAQMDNVVKRYKKCDVERVVYSDDGVRAVLLHSLINRECDPFTFERGEDGNWRLDLKAIGLGIGHTYGNVWYVHGGRIEESGIWKYYFGFKDYYFHRPDEERFDHQRFPYYLWWGIHMNHVTWGAVVQKIHGKDSYIAKSGIKEGDVILRWEGVDFPHNVYIANRMKNVREGLDVDILLQRNNEQYHMIIKAPPKPLLPGSLRWGATYQSTGSRLPVVHHVTPNSIGDKMGLKAGDRIVYWDGIDNPSTNAVYDMMGDAAVGDGISVRVMRDGGQVSLHGEVAARREMGPVQ